MVDLLYDIVVKATEWPTHDRVINNTRPTSGLSNGGILILWHCARPSSGITVGTESGDLAVKQRILDYNEE